MYSYSVWVAMKNSNKRKTVRSSELQRSVGKVLRRVAVNGESLIIERGGYPVAVLMPYQEYEQIQRQMAEKLHRELTAALSQEAQQQGLTEEQLMVELEADKQALYQERYDTKAT